MRWRNYEHVNYTCWFNSESTQNCVQEAKWDEDTMRRVLWFSAPGKWQLCACSCPKKGEGHQEMGRTGGGNNLQIEACEVLVRNTDSGISKVIASLVLPLPNHLLLGKLCGHSTNSHWAATMCHVESQVLEIQQWSQDTKKLCPCGTAF